MSVPSRWMRACTEQVHRSYNEYWSATAIALKPHDTVNYINTTAGAVVVTMPPVSEAPGVRFMIMHWLGAPTVTIQAFKSDSPNFPTIAALALNGVAVLISDGTRWKSADVTVVGP
jgi:hypothetical protein